MPPWQPGRPNAGCSVHVADDEKPWCRIPEVVRGFSRSEGGPRGSQPTCARSIGLQLLRRPTEGGGGGGVLEGRLGNGEGDQITRTSIIRIRIPLFPHIFCCSTFSGMVLLLENLYFLCIRTGKSLFQVYFVCISIGKQPSWSFDAALSRPPTPRTFVARSQSGSKRCAGSGSDGSQKDFLVLPQDPQLCVWGGQCMFSTWPFAVCGRKS